MATAWPKRVIVFLVLLATLVNISPSAAAETGRTGAPVLTPEVFEPCTINRTPVGSPPPDGPLLAAGPRGEEHRRELRGVDLQRDQRGWRWVNGERRQSDNAHRSEVTSAIVHLLSGPRIHVRISFFRFAITSAGRSRREGMSGSYDHSVWKETSQSVVSSAGSRATSSL